MDTGTALLVGVVAGLLLGAASSFVTRRAGIRPGILVGVGVAVVGLVVIAIGGEDALAPAVGAMLAFAVAAGLLDPRPKGLIN